MTEAVSDEARVSSAKPVDYLVLMLVCATAALAAVFEVFLVPLYVGGTLFPITVLLAAATTWSLPRLGSWLIGSASGAVLPMAAWLLVVLVLGFLSRPEGDVVIQGGNSEQWVMFAMVIVGAVIGFSTVMRTNLNR